MQELTELIGETKSQKVIDETLKIYREKFDKHFPNYFDKPNTKMICLVTALDNNEIKSIGMSKTNDLLLDQWGNILGMMLDGASATREIKQESGALRFIRVWGSPTSCLFRSNNGATGTFIKLGDGVSAVARTDFNIESQIEANINTLAGGWNSGLGKVDIPATAVASVGITIKEVGLFGKWNSQVPASVSNYMISHDNLNPFVSAITGQTINVDYQLLLG